MNTLSAVLFAATVSFFLASLFVLHLLRRRRWQEQRSAAAAMSGECRSKDSAFLLFGLCFKSRQFRVEPSAGHVSRQPQPPEEHCSGEQAEAGECELERWKRMCAGPSRALYTIDEATEKGTTPLTTPAASPDRRGRAPEAGTATTTAKT